MMSKRHRRNRHKSQSKSAKPRIISLESGAFSNTTSSPVSSTIQNMANGHALVFGASGLVGWAVVDQLLGNYPVKDTFSEITALVNRPLKIEDSYWTPPSPGPQPELQLVSGINLMQGTVEEFTALMAEKVKDMGTVTHVFYFAYKQEAELYLEVPVNRGMMERVVGALTHLSPNLKFIVYPTGTRAYGIYKPGGLYKPPLVESMDPLPEPMRSEVFYYAIREVLQEGSKGKEWTWCDIRPDAIVGFSPNGSTYNITAHWATYLSLYAHVEGKGTKVPFPGSEAGWTCLSNDVAAATVAKSAIWASLHPEKTGGQIFNIADQERPVSMREKWPVLARYFGLEGVAPSDDPNILPPSEYVKKHAHVLERLGIKANTVFQGAFLDTYGFYLSFDRHMSLEKIRKAGFGEEVDPNVAWFKAFDKFREAGMIIP